jgi:succinyl-CoA synthetase beta subunit
MWTKGSVKIIRAAICNQNFGQQIIPRRWLNLQEYQSKDLLQKFGLKVQRFVVIDSAQSAEKELKNFKADEYVVKAQILAGGRGKGHFSSGLQGGVKLTKKPEEIPNFVKKMIGFNLVTKQTPPEGVLVKKVMIAESVDIKRECYVAVLLDREVGSPVIIASPAGGMDIEEVALKTPHLIFKEYVDMDTGFTNEQATRLSKNLGFKGKLADQATDQLKRLYKLFTDVDATQVEINPFSETACNNVYCIDAKLNFDDSAEFRQKSIFSMDDHADEDPREVEANRYKLNYIGMTGNIACLVNGAGLAMATMDIIKLYGGEPANFLDVGGAVQEEQVTHAFRILTSDENVKAILVNIFGGIVNCETIAKGLTGAFSRMALNVPLIVRLEGTNVERARQILNESRLPIITATDLDDAAKKAVRCLSGR